MKIQLWTAGMLYCIGTFKLLGEATTVITWRDRLFLVNPTNTRCYCEVSGGAVEGEPEFDPMMSNYLPPTDPRFKSWRETK